MATGSGTTVVPTSQTGSAFEREILFEEKRRGNKIPTRPTEKPTGRPFLGAVMSGYVLSWPLENASLEDSRVHAERKKNTNSQCPPFPSGHSDPTLEMRFNLVSKA